MKNLDPEDCTTCRGTGIRPLGASPVQAEPPEAVASSADVKWQQVGHPRVRGRCPSCGAESLFLGSNGYVTCGVIEGCKDPGAATDLLQQWKSWGVIEIAIRNPNVSSYMNHWEGRALKAESEVAALREALSLCRNKLSALAMEFNSSRFTDRHGDGPDCDALVVIADAALARAEKVLARMPRECFAECSLAEETEGVVRELVLLASLRGAEQPQEPCDCCRGEKDKPGQHPFHCSPGCRCYGRCDDPTCCEPDEVGRGAAEPPYEMPNPRQPLGAAEPEQPPDGPKMKPERT